MKSMNPVTIRLIFVCVTIVPYIVQDEPWLHVCATMFFIERLNVNIIIARITDIAITNTPTFLFFILF